MDGLALFGGGRLQRGWLAGPAGRGWLAAAVQDQQAWLGSPRAVAQGGQLSLGAYSRSFSGVAAGRTGLLKARGFRVRGGRSPLGAAWR